MVTEDEPLDAWSLDPFPVAAYCDWYITQQREQRGMLVYNRCSDEELRRFCRQRGLRQLQSVSNREDMIYALERADDEGATFARFLDLPPELQLRVYDLYKSSLGDNFGPFSVAPPLTAVSKLVRHDAASVFFSDRIFICSLTPRNDLAVGQTRHLYLEDITALFFDKAPLHFLQSVRRLEIMAPLPEPATSNPGGGYAEWLLDLRARTRETRVAFEGMGTYWRAHQSPQEMDCAINAVQEQLRDVVDGIIAREHPVLHREDATAILAALGTLPGDTVPGKT